MSAASPSSSPATDRSPPPETSASAWRQRQYPTSSRYPSVFIRAAAAAQATGSDAPRARVSSASAMLA